MKRRPRKRRGLSTLWLLLLMPIAMIKLCFVIEIGNLWLARVELEMALESASLAAVKAWGDQNGGDTLAPRQIGVKFAGANVANCVPVVIETNYDDDGSDGPNQNEDCLGDLLFGTIVVDDPDDPESPVIFNADIAPTCGLGDVLFDATNQGNVDDDDSWGISFRAFDDPFLNANLRIVKVEIDTDPDGDDNASFDFDSGGAPEISDNSGPKVMDQDPTPPNSQDDNVGFTIDYLAMPPTSPQIVFWPTTGKPEVLTIEFFPDGMGDTGFNPGDRFRFGANVRVQQGNGPNFGQASGDDIGALDKVHAKVTVYFQLGAGPITMAMGFFEDNMTKPIDSKNACIDNYIVTDAIGQDHLVVHGRQILDLPCPPTAAANNNGQSYVIIQGEGDMEFAVHAQKVIMVDPICNAVFGLPMGPFMVSAKTTAVYDCIERRPRLVHEDQVICEMMEVIFPPPPP